MLAKELNERMTRVGPGTPMGELMRRYWHPVAAAVELEENPVKKVRLLCEDLVLYRDKSGNLGLIDEPCPHRRVSLEYGIPEAEGLRCPYHGWVFNHEGRCLEQPAEPWDSTFKDRVTTKSYPVQEFAGLVFAYLGPSPAPLIPRYDVYVVDNAVRHIGGAMLPCNWIQCMENSLDPVHAEWLHSYYSNYVRERQGKPPRPRPVRRHKRIGFTRFEHGILKRRVLDGHTQEDESWTDGHPIVFPNMLRQGNGGASGFYMFEIRVPVDDDHTWHIMYVAHRPGVPAAPQESIPYFEVPLYQEDGRLRNDFVTGQDHMAWVTQGPIARRDLEHLGQSDVGVIMYREMLLEQIDRVERGEDPMEFYRDPAKNQRIDMPHEGIRSTEPYPGYKMRGGHMRFDPKFDEVADLYHAAEATSAAGGRFLPWTVPPLIPWEEEHTGRQVVIKP